jgi:hypothetical protein
MKKVGRGHKNVPEDIWHKVEIGSVDECWPCKNKRSERQGYGYLKMCGKMYPAHRMEIFKNRCGIYQSMDRRWF